MPAVGGPAPGGPGSPGGPATPGSPGGGNPTMPGNPGSPSGPGLPGGMGNPSAPADPNAAGPQPLRRLDRREYNNTVRDLLGDTTRPADRFPSDRDTEFVFRHAGLVSSQDYSTIQDAAEALAAAAEKNVATLAPCAGAAPRRPARASSPPTSACAPTAARWSTAEIDSLVQLYKEARAAPISLPTTPAASSMMIEGILQSPGLPLPLGGRPGGARRSRARWSSSTTTRTPRSCRTSCGARCPTRTLFDAGRRQEAGHPGRARGAGPPHAGRPQGPRHRVASSSRSGWAWTRWPSARRTRCCTPSSRTT